MKQKADKSILKVYWLVWKRLTLLQFQVQIANARGAAILFILGKLLRLGTAFLFVYVVINKAHALAGYNLAQAILILAIFNLVSTFTQLFFRGVYVFRRKVVDGAFDFFLLNPLSELFYALFSYTDPMDLLLLLPYSGIVIWAWGSAGYEATLASIISLLLVIGIMSLFVFAFHVVIISIGVKYLEVDNTIMLYRDIEKMATLPIEVYGKYLSAFLTYIIPFGLMATIPARIIFGSTSSLVLLYFLPLALVFVYLSLKFWNHSLKSYSSASS